LTDYNKYKFYMKDEYYEFYLNDVIKDSGTLTAVTSLTTTGRGMVLDYALGPNPVFLQYIYYDYIKLSYNSQDIESVYRSPEIMPIPDREAELRYIYLTMQKQTTGYMEVGYKTDFDTTFTTQSVYMGGTGVENARLPVPAGMISKVFQFQLREESDDSNFEVNKLNAYFIPKPFR